MKLRISEQQVIDHLLNLGLIKKEAQFFLRKNVHKLNKDDINKIKTYQTHFGESGRKKITEIILEEKREEFLKRLIFNKLPIIRTTF